jgi:two-component system response regulator RpaA
MGRVLVVEDDAAISQLLRVILEADGHEVLVANDGSRGLAMAARRSPDAIAVLEALREDERTVAIPVLMLSAIQKESVEERCYRLGAQAFIRKPFDPDMLVGSIQELITAPPPLKTEQVSREPREVPLAVILAWRDGA